MVPQVRLLNLPRMGFSPVIPSSIPNPPSQPVATPAHLVLIGIAGLIGLIIIIARFWCSLARHLGWHTRGQATANPTSRPNRTVQALKFVLPSPIHEWIWPPGSVAAAEGAHPSIGLTPSTETLPVYPGPIYLPSYNQATRHHPLFLILHPAVIIHLFQQSSPEPDLEAGLRSEPPHPQGGHIALRWIVPPSIIPTEPPPIYSYAARDPPSPPSGSSRQL